MPGCIHVTTSCQCLDMVASSSSKGVVLLENRGRCVTINSALAVNSTISITWELAVLETGILPPAALQQARNDYRTWAGKASFPDYLNNIVVPGFCKLPIRATYCRSTMELTLELARQDHRSSWRLEGQGEDRAVLNAFGAALATVMALGLLFLARDLASKPY